MKTDGFYCMYICFPTRTDCFCLKICVSVSLWCHHCLTFTYFTVMEARLRLSPFFLYFTRAFSELCWSQEDVVCSKSGVRVYNICVKNSSDQSAFWKKSFWVKTFFSPFFFVSVYTVNYRGSTGFGQDSILSLIGQIGSQDVKDVQVPADTESGATL